MLSKKSVIRNSNNTQLNKPKTEENNNLQSESVNYNLSDFSSEVIVYPNTRKLKTLLRKNQNGYGKKFEKKLYGMLRDQKRQANDDNSEVNTVISDTLKKSYLLSPASSINVIEGVFFGEDNTDNKRIKK